MICDVHADADEEVQAAAELSYSRLRETPCHWAGCGAVLNSSHTLQKHLALHAGEQGEWVRTLSSLPFFMCYVVPD